jgi:putative ABC transport system substrate-binding protein
LRKAAHGRPFVYGTWRPSERWRCLRSPAGSPAYGASLADLFRRSATYVDKILKGAKPADLPVEQPTEFDLAINLKTAKALGLEISTQLVARADVIVE